MARIIVFVGTVLLATTGLLEACPDQCVCKWKGGKQTVECINQGLEKLPLGIDPETQVLDISGSVLQVLHGGLFNSSSLLNLQKIYLSRCRLGHLDPRSLHGLTNLVELDLSDNMLIAVPTEPLRDVPSLMRLSLARNPIQRLPRQSFSELQYLTWLDLSNCQIETIEIEAFEGLRNLEWLRLDNNHLTDIAGSLVLPVTLHGITLHGNPWYCDCRMGRLHSWLVFSNVPTTIDPVCSLPEKVTNRSVRGLDPGDLACPPQLATLSEVLEVTRGRNASLLCQVTSGHPEPRITWWRYGQRLRDKLILATGNRSLLTIVNVTNRDSGAYACIAENRAGVVTGNFTLIVLTPTPRTTSSHTMEYAAIVGGSVAAIVFTLMTLVIAIAVRCRCLQKETRACKEPRVEVSPVEAKPEIPLPVVPSQASDCVDHSPDLLKTPRTKWQEISVDSAVFDISRDRNTSGSIQTISETIPQTDYLQLATQQRIRNTSQSSWFLDSEGFPIDYGLPKLIKDPTPPHYENYYLDGHGNFLPGPKQSAEHRLSYSTSNDLGLVYERHPERASFQESAYGRTRKLHESPDEGYEDEGADGTEI